ncbi:MAG: D-alanyl-D-alanine carboxypeptidase family protein [Christensenellales bacterium]|jgi:D-alanyl-D-alanine carboxypeptidase
MRCWFLRRIASAFVCLIIAVGILPSARASSEYDANHPENLFAAHIRAESAILIEAESGNVIFEKNADDIRYPASLTKIMTIMIALMMCEDDEMVTVSENAVNIPADSSKIGLKAGETLPMIDLIKATMIKSGNDGSIAIAEHVSGSEPAFVNLMNETARQFGCTNTNFVNSHGYHDEYHYSTVRDIAIIAREAMKYPAFQEIAALWRFTLPRTNMSDARALTSTDADIFNPESDAYYPYITGIKTGQHSMAGYCYAGSSYKNGISLISVVCKSNKAGRWTDTRRLMDYGYTQYISTSVEEIFRKNPKVVDISAYALDDDNLGRLPLDIQKKDPAANDNLFGLLGQDDMWMHIYNTRTSISYTRTLEAPVAAGEIIGTMIYRPEGSDAEPVEYDLIATRSINRREAAAPSLEAIRAYTEADPNPFPRFSLEFLFIMLLPVFAVMILARLLFKLLTKKRKPRIRRTAGYKTRYYR